jgi:Cellulose biosynthesis protein BcsS
MKSVKSAVAVVALTAACVGVGASAPAVAGDGYGQSNIVFPAAIVSGADITARAKEGYLGLYFALNGDLDRDGIIVRILGSGSKFDYSYGANHINGVAAALGKIEGTGWQGDAMVGYQWVRNGFDFSVLVGVDHQDYSLSPNDPFTQLRGSETGFKTAVDLETNTSNRGPVYLAMRGAYSTAFDSYYALGRVGMKTGRFAIGPEMWALGDVSGNALRAGGFMLFDIPFSPTRVGQLSFSAGYQWGDESKNTTALGKGYEDGAYGTVKFNLALGRETVSYEPRQPLK